jgi:hypothetical protein
VRIPLSAIARRDGQPQPFAGSKPRYFLGFSGQATKFSPVAGQ